MNLKVNRRKLAEVMANLGPCGRAPHWARVLTGQSHKIKLVAPQFTKSFVHSKKSDRADAEAVCEAVQRPEMRFLGIKTIRPTGSAVSAPDTQPSG